MLQTNRCLLLIILALIASATAFVSQQRRPQRAALVSRTSRRNAVADKQQAVEQQQQEEESIIAPSASLAVQLSEEEINQRLAAQLEKLRIKDATSPLLSKEELKIVYEDDHIVVVDKPAGVLSVSGKNGAHSLAEAVFAAVEKKCDDSSLNDDDANHMVVHRLGMDTSGLMVLAKTLPAVRGLNTVFRTRAIERQYEALVCGRVERKKTGIIDLPLMRDYEYPPYVRISTEAHQEMLVDLNADLLDHSTLLELPKESLTKYTVVQHEELGGQPVTRVKLTSISGRTHQLNCHLAALGHPIVGDSTYGLNGAAAPNGGLSDAELQYMVRNTHRATETEQAGANAAAAGRSCVHAKSLKFIHPITKKPIELSSDAPF